EKKFWDFSMDELALYDLPDTIDYILDITGAPSLTYIGFSQGSAQCFAALSINPKMNKKINLFIALAPATSPGGLRSAICNALIKSSPNVLYLIFGRKAMLSMVLFWKKVLSPPIFTKIVDVALKFLFDWDCNNITEIQKIIGYYHLYSCSSVKCIVHWFQIIKSKSFQMYDELPQYSGLDHSCQCFPTPQITTPIAVFYGGRDSLGDISTLLKQIPTPVLIREITNYEHLDFIWASDLGVNLYPDIFDLIIQYSHPNFREDEYRRDENEILFDFSGSDEDHGYDERRKNGDDMGNDSENNQRHINYDSSGDLQPQEMYFSEIRHSELHQSSAGDSESRRSEVLYSDDKPETQRLTQGHASHADDESMTYSEPEVVTMVETSGDDDDHQPLQRVIEGSDDDFAMS
ncbi:13364_t:CDS:2, partial [Acaulospora morrowiae]